MTSAWRALIAPSQLNLIAGVELSRWPSVTMIFRIPNLLAPEELEYFTSSLAQAEFVDYKLTAGWHAKLVKNNHQLKHSESQQELKELIKKATQP